jgi:hypothetical protein
MSRAKTILCLAIAMLVASAFLVVAQDRVDLAAATPDTGTQIPDLPLHAAVGGMGGVAEASFGAAALEQNPYNNIDGVPTFGAFARTESR